MVGLPADIQERERLTAELHQRVVELQAAQDRIQSLVDNVIDGIITINESGIVETMNPAAEQLFGYAAEEVIGQNVKMLMPEPFKAEHDQYLQNYLQTGLAKIIGIGREVIGRRKDGSTFPMYLAVGEFQFNERHFFTGIVRDITERKLVERNLRLLADISSALGSLTDFETMLQRMASLVVPSFADWCAIDVVTADGVKRVAVMHADPEKVREAAEHADRYPVAPQQPFGPYQVIRTGQSEMVMEVTAEMLARAAQSEEHLRLLHDLNVRSYICVPLKNRDQTFGAIMFLTAESRRRYHESDLAFAEELAQRAAVALENARLYNELCEADRQKDVFLAMLAHELRNPLAPIKTSLQILQLSDVDPDTARRSREMMDRQVDHLMRLVDDLLDVSRVQRGKIELRRERVDLNSIIARAVETVQPLIDGMGHSLTVNWSPLPLDLHIDPVRLTQVFGNLLNNAAKYMEPGGRIQVLVERHESSAAVRISDEGIGIDAATLPKIFELFVQADQSAARSQGGLGIGLTLVKRLVEMHGGTVEAHSRGVGKGSEFVVRLPLASDEQTAEPNPALQAEEAPAKKTYRALVVDDNIDAAESLALLLGLIGHEATAVHDGRTAVALAENAPFDVVFLDLGMPGMDGYELAQKLQALSTMTNVKLVAVTGWGQAEHRERSKAVGIHHHLIKPADLRSLEEVLRLLR